MKSKYDVQMIENNSKPNNTTRKKNVLLLTTGGNGCWSSRRTRRNRGSFERKQIYQIVGGAKPGEFDKEDDKILGNKFISQKYFNIIEKLLL
jgi:hypothetical protein